MVRGTFTIRLRHLHYLTTHYSLLPWPMTNPVLVEITRGPFVESIHRGALAVSDARGRLRMAVGDIERPIFPRSALKPIQAVPLVESGATEKFALSDEEMALACASHSG